MDRIIADFGTGAPGPTILCIGSLHGSEPAGARAAARVADQIAGRDLPVAGRLVLVRGNLAALQAGTRYVDVDLNRLWDPAEVDAVVAGPTADEPAEHAEMRELHDILHSVAGAAEGPVCVLDLHTTSSPGMPFMWLIPSVGIEAILPEYGLPMVHDSLGRIHGTLGQYAAALGHEVIVAEGGQHADPRAADAHEAVVWLTLARLGAVREGHATDALDRARAELRDRAPTGPALYEIAYHHKIDDTDGFRMVPGYESFMQVSAGERLATDLRGPVAAPVSGRILMPLYQPPCDDGFMIVAESDSWPAPSAR